MSLVNELFTATMAAQEPAAVAAAAASAATLEPCEAVTSLQSCPPEDKERWHKAGLLAIAEGKLGALVLAGGQGTRLGSDRPKGEYNIQLPSGKPLFQLMAERITRLKEVAAAAAGKEASAISLPFYVMTSPMTDKETREFFSLHAFFGLPKEDVFFFSQGTLPCMSMEGKILLESAGKVAEAPDGNGGIYRALHLSGAVADMEKRGVVGLHVFAVDNALVRVADPVFLGFCLESKADVGSKVCPKTGPHEKVGVLCRRGGAYAVVEYSEMDRASQEALDAATGKLKFNAGNLCIHYYSLAFLQGPASPAQLPKVYHLAKKAIPVADEGTGNTVSKEQLKALGNTGIKLESFIFDVFPAAQRMSVLEVVREEEFAPVKNAPGSKEDSPDTARQLTHALHSKWLAAAGVSVSSSSGASASVEVSPLVSYGGEGLLAVAEAVAAAAAAGSAGGAAAGAGTGAAGEGSSVSLYVGKKGHAAEEALVAVLKEKGATAVLV